MTDSRKTPLLLAFCLALLARTSSAEEVKPTDEQVAQAVKLLHSPDTTFQQKGTAELRDWGKRDPDRILKAIEAGEADGKFCTPGQALLKSLPWEARKWRALRLAEQDAVLTSLVTDLFDRPCADTFRAFALKARGRTEFSEPLSGFLKFPGTPRPEIGDIREEALALLACLGDPAVFTEMLKDADKGVPDLMPEALALVKDPSFLPRLRELSKGPPGLWAAIALSHMGDKEGPRCILELLEKGQGGTGRILGNALICAPDAVPMTLPRLLKVLDGRNTDAQREAIEALGSAGKSSAGSRIAAFLDVPDSAMWETAARALGRMHSSAGTQHLLGKLTDPKCQAPKYNTLNLLGLNGDKKAVGDIGPYLSHQDTEFAAAIALGCLGSKSGEASLRKFMKPGALPQARVAVALADLGDKQVIAKLGPLLIMSQEAHGDIVEAIGNSKDISLAPFLAYFLALGLHFPANQEALALSKLTGSSWGDNVIEARLWWREHREDPDVQIDKCLTDKEPYVRIAACKVAAKLVMLGALPGIKALLQDPDQNVRNAAGLASSELQLHVQPAPPTP